MSPAKPPMFFPQSSLGFQGISGEETAFWERIRSLTEQVRGLNIEAIELKEYTGFDVEFLRALAAPYAGIIHWDVEILVSAPRVTLYYGEHPNSSALALVLKEYITRFDLPDIMVRVTGRNFWEIVVVRKGKPFRILTHNEVFRCLWEAEIRV